MKVVCINNSYIQSIGIEFHNNDQSESLTIGKVYETFDDSESIRASGTYIHNIV